MADPIKSLLPHLIQHCKGDPRKKAYEIVKDAADLCALSNRLHKIAERQCNGYSDYRSGADRMEARDATTEKRLQAAVVAITKKYRIYSVELNVDVRCGGGFKLLWTKHSTSYGGFVV